MEGVEEIQSFLYNLTYHLFESGRELVNMMIRRAWRNTLEEHNLKHTPDVNNCPYCRYDREIVEPRITKLHLDWIRARRNRVALSPAREEIDTEESSN